MKKYNYDELMELTKEYRETFDSLYKLHTQNEGDIDIIYQLVENNLIKTKYLTPSEVLYKISLISLCNNRYIKSYWILFKKIFEKYQPREVSRIEKIFNYFAYMEYGIILDRYQKEDYNFKQYSSNFHEEDQTLRSIVNDDIKSFIPLLENDPTYHFSYPEYFHFPISMLFLSIIELCCYYGAVDCFKFLRTKFNVEITPQCLYYSFLSGNPDIMHLCLKEQKPDKECMKYAIISRNIDFVSFLMNEYNININLEYCVEYNNLHAFFVYLDTYKKLKQCFVYSPRFGIPSLCEYFISHRVDVKARAKKGITALHSAALNKNKRTAEYLISHGANIFVKDKKLRTPFYYAACNNNKDPAELLIYPHCNEMDINREKPIDIAIQKNYSEIVNLLISHGIIQIKQSYLFKAIHYNSIEVAELLILNGADVNEKYKSETTPLYEAIKVRKIEMVKLLILHGADVNEKCTFGKTPLHEAITKNREFIEVLISHGANINAKDNNGETPLHIAQYSEKEIFDLLISHGADINSKDAKRRTPHHIDYLTTYPNFILLA